MKPDSQNPPIPAKRKYKSKEAKDLRRGLGIHLTHPIGVSTKLPLPEVPKGCIGIRAPESIESAPGGFLIFEGDSEKPAKDFGFCVCNFSYYGQVRYL